jgi:tetratricopeptide (TPR) repeat protein
MVTCRPEGAGFIDPRSIAAPLLDALDSLPEQFEVEFLRPPTLKALDERLRDETKPPVHIVHFDGHGVYDKSVGLGFLLFEDESHQQHLVDAEQLGTLLNRSGIPLMVLNACQSAQPDDRNPFASVASRLIEAGVGGVVAMNYSVLVETAKRLTREFYGALARGKSVSAAMDAARRDLFRDTKRLTLRRPHQDAELIIHLQDWFLPALYQQADELIPFSPSPQPFPERGGSLPSPQPSPAGGGSQSPSPTGRGARGEGKLRGDFPPPPLHGFHGRARELLDLERAFATRNIVVLHGFGGQGKTALATQAADWFTRTRLFERAAFLSFENGASFEFVLNALGNALVEENFQIYAGDKVEAIARSLREKPALVIFDNFESVLPDGNAPMTELQTLLDAAARWFAPTTNHQLPITNHQLLITHSALLITTRNPSIPHPAFAPGKTCLHKELTGLDPSDALELAASILEAYSLPRPPRLPLEELLAFLKGHPLSLQLALPQLRDYSAEQLVAEYQTLLPQMKTGAAKERNESLEVSLRFSLDRLGEDARSLLTRLTVFEGGAMENALLAITEIPETRWNELKPQLVSTALIRLEELEGITVPFVHFHPTLIPYLRALPESQTNYQLQITNYWQQYYQLAKVLHKMDIQHPIQARAIVLRELPNLKRALNLTLAAGALDEAVTFADRLNWFLNYFGRWREREEVAAEVDRYTRTQVNMDRKITKREYLLESGRGERLLQQGRAAQAEQVFRALLSRLEGQAAYDTRYDQTLVLGYLGRCLRAQGRHSQAADCYRRALALAGTLEQTENAKHQISAYHADLADTLAFSGLYADAKQEYESSLTIAKEIDDGRQQGVVLGQLGTLAMLQGDLDEARQRYLEALRLFQRMGEDQSEAVAWHQLGRVAEEARDWDEAERCYKQALTICERIQDLPQLAGTCNQLALVAESAGRFEEGERWAKKALKMQEELGNSRGIAVAHHKLAVSLKLLNKLDEAAIHIEEAIKLYSEIQDFENNIKAYGAAADIAEKRGRMDEARAWRRKEQESFAAFAGSDTQIKQYEPLIAAIVNAAKGDEKAKAFLEGEYPKMQASGERWVNASKSIQKLVAGERDFAKLTDGMDREISLIIRRILQALNGEQTADRGPQTEENRPRSTVNGQPQQEQGMTLSQLLEMVERAADGDQQLGGQLFTAFQQMARAEDPLLSALGGVLLRVLIGERNPNLDGLPDDLASAVRGLLGRLKNR